MSTHHAYTEFHAGDDWAILATLLNADGSPYDLTDANVEWILLGPDGQSAIVTGYTVQIVGDSPTEGQALIFVDKSLTSPLGPGYYMDALRATKPSVPDPNTLITTTMWDGSIGVCINMFYPLMPTFHSGKYVAVVTQESVPPPPPPALRHVQYPDALTSMVLGPALPPSAGPLGPFRPTAVPQTMVPSRAGGMAGYDALPPPTEQTPTVALPTSPAPVRRE
jgi:hypothetical protein